MILMAGSVLFTLKVRAYGYSISLMSSRNYHYYFKSEFLTPCNLGSLPDYIALVHYPIVLCAPMLAENSKYTLIQCLPYGVHEFHYLDT